MLVQKNSDLTEEYKLPVGGEVKTTTECWSSWSITGVHRVQGRLAEDHSGRVGRRPERHEDDCEVLAHLQVRSTK